MKTCITVVIIVLMSCLLFGKASNNGQPWSPNSPIIDIVSPLNQTYSQTDPMILNVTIESYIMGSTNAFFSLDNQANISLPLMDDGEDLKNANLIQVGSVGLPSLTIGSHIIEIFANYSEIHHYDGPIMPSLYNYTS